MGGRHAAPAREAPWGGLGPAWPPPGIRGAQRRRAPRPETARPGRPDRRQYVGLSTPPAFAMTLPSAIVRSLRLQLSVPAIRP